MLVRKIEGEGKVIAKHMPSEAKENNSVCECVCVCVYVCMHGVCTYVSVCVVPVEDRPRQQFVSSSFVLSNVSRPRKIE